MTKIRIFETSTVFICCCLYLTNSHTLSNIHNETMPSNMYEPLISIWDIQCEPNKTTILMGGMQNITCNIKGPKKSYSEYHLVIRSKDTSVARAHEEEIWLQQDRASKRYFSESFLVDGVFVGRTDIDVFVFQKGNQFHETKTSVEATVIKKKTVLDSIFNFSIIGLVTLMYINFGCAFKWDDLKENLRRPYGPCIGMTLQFFLMPLISFGLARLLFPDNTYLQLGLFFTGVAPSGGASNLWTVLAGGNLELSVTMTTLSNFMAFGMIPFWVFTLGTVIYDEGDVNIPYVMIMEYCVCLVVPLLIGYALTVCRPKVAEFLARILKRLSAILLLFIVVFACITNYYIFELFTWQIVVSGLGLPWLGYLFGYVCALICKRNQKDATTIAIETGIQNTGVPILLLKAALEHPFSDMSIVMPVAVAVMTPIPLIILVTYRTLKKRYEKRSRESRKLIDSLECSNSPMSEYNDNNYNLTGPKSEAKLKLIEDQLIGTMDLQCNI